MKILKTSIIIFCVFFGVATAHAGTTVATVTWDLSNVAVGSYDFDSLVCDVDFGGEFLQMNGVMIASSGLRLMLYGTGEYYPNRDIFIFDISFSGLIARLVLDGQTLTGSIVLHGMADGTLYSEGTMFARNIRIY